MNRQWIFQLAVIIIAATLSACSTGHTSKEADAAKTPSPQPPTTLIVRQGHMLPHVHLAGIIAPFQNVALQSTLTEPADRVDVQEGDSVTRGQELAYLDTADLLANLHASLALVQANNASAGHAVFQGRLNIDQGNNTLISARSAVAQARANLQRDQADLRRYQNLYSNGYVSQQQVTLSSTTVANDQQALQSAIAGVATAQSGVQANGSLTSSGLQSTTIEQARAIVAQAEAQAEQFRVQIQKATIISPIDGIVVNRNLNPGEYPGTRQIFTIQQVNPLYAILHGSGAEIAQMVPGSAATITVADLHNRQVHGTVIGILNQLNPGSTDFEVKVQLSNANRQLRPGMAIEGLVDLPMISGMKIPLHAFTTVAHNSVTLITPAGSTIEHHVVSLGEDEKNAIVSGIASGSRVVIK